MSLLFISSIMIVIIIVVNATERIGQSARLKEGGVSPNFLRRGASAQVYGSFVENRGDLRRLTFSLQMTNM